MYTRILVQAFTLVMIGVVLASCTPTRVAYVANPEPSLGPDRGVDSTIINSHLHASFLGGNDSEYLAEVLAEMGSNNISLALLHINEASDIDDWVKAAPGKFLAGPSFPCVETGRGSQASCKWDEGDWPSISWLRQNYEDGTFSIMGELLNVYAGIAPDDERMDGYWSLAAELDVPVFIHINRGPPPDSPSRPVGCCPNFDADLGNPALLRPVLEKYPKLRISLQHAGFPALPQMGGIEYSEETFALLSDYPNVYVDMTALNSVPPPFVHEAAVRQFLDRGFIDRLMMGTDNWEAAQIIDRYLSFDFLSVVEKRGILFDNAARFLRLQNLSE